MLWQLVCNLLHAIFIFHALLPLIVCHNIYLCPLKILAIVIYSLLKPNCSAYFKMTLGLNVQKAETSALGLRTFGCRDELGLLDGNSVPVPRIVGEEWREQSSAVPGRWHVPRGFLPFSAGRGQV